MPSAQPFYTLRTDILEIHGEKPAATWEGH